VKCEGLLEGCIHILYWAIANPAVLERV